MTNSPDTKERKASRDPAGAVHECVICDYVRSLPPEKHLWDDDDWLAGPVMDVPGWVMIMTKRHAEGTWALNDAEAASFGIVLRDLMGLIKELTGAPRLHYMVAGEAVLHYHTVIIPRLEDQVPIWATADLVRRGQELADPPAANAMTERLLERLRRPASLRAG